MKLSELFESQSEYNKLLNAIKTYCPNNFKDAAGNNKYLFRGIDLIGMKGTNSVAFKVIKPLTKPRNSLTGNNMANAMISKLPSWKKIPNRFYSVFCGTDEVAREFGNLHLVIPFDNVESYATISHDWNFKEGGAIIINKTVRDIIEAVFYMQDSMFSQVKYLQSLADTTKDSESIHRLQKFYIPEVLKTDKLFSKFIDRYSKTKLTVDDYFEIIKQIDRLYLELKDFESRSTRYEITYSITSIIRKIRKIVGDGTLEDWVKNEFTPTKLKVKLYNNYASLKIPKSDEPEIWFVGGYIAIDLVGSDPATHPTIKKLLADLS